MIDPLFDKIGIYLHPKFGELKQYELLYANKTRRYLVNKKNNCNIIHDNELDYYDDLNSLAALISVCDYVVTGSNVTAHIAGRLGVRTFLMIPKYFGNIWYWNESNNQSKWYPSVTIFKQKQDMNWDDPIKEIKKLVKA